MFLGLGTAVIMLYLYTHTRPNIVPSRSLSRTRHCRPHPPAHKQVRHCRSDHMSQPRNGTWSQPVGELYLDNASRRNFVDLFRIGFGVFLLTLGLVCGRERCRGYGKWFHNQIPTKQVRRDHQICSARVTCCLGLARSAHPTQLRLGNACAIGDCEGGGDTLSGEG